MKASTQLKIFAIGFVLVCLTALACRAASPKLSDLNPSKTELVFMGDSISAASFSFPYLVQTYYGTNHFIAFTNSATAGNSLIPDITNDWAMNVHKYSPGSGTNTILTLLIGANDYTDTIIGETPQAYCGQLSNTWKMFQASNCLVVAMTITERADFDGESPASLTNLTIINSFIRTSNIPDYIVDDAAILGTNENPIYFSSGTHPTAAAHVIIFNEWYRVLNGLMLKNSWFSAGH